MDLTMLAVKTAAKKMTHEEVIRATCDSKENIECTNTIHRCVYHAWWNFYQAVFAIMHGAEKEAERQLESARKQLFILNQN